jgi:hypothetical protein
VETGNRHEEHQRENSFLQGQAEIYQVKVKNLMDKLHPYVQTDETGEKLTELKCSTYDKVVPCAHAYTRWFMLKHGRDKMKIVPVRSNHPCLGKLCSFGM